MERGPAGANAEGDGIVVGGGPVTVDAYVDFICPYCRRFEEASGAALTKMVEEGAIALVYHPLNFLDRLSTTRYSSRAASASAAASDQGAFRVYKDALFAGQPPENGPGLTDEQLVAIGRDVGITAPEFESAVSGHAYLDWVEFVTERAIARGVDGTPIVFVAGVEVQADAQAIAAAVAATAGQRDST